MPASVERHQGPIQGKGGSVADRQVVENPIEDRELAGSEIGLAQRSADRPIRGSDHPLLELLIVLAKRKSFILKFVCAVALGALVIALLLPDTYTANAGVLPARRDQSLPAALTNQPGFPRGSNLSDLCLAMLHSETVANRLIDRFDLMKVYGARLRTDARKSLANRTEINLDKDGVVSISVDDRNPQRAADLTNGYVEELEALAKSLAAAQAHKQREFFANQVTAASGELANAEQSFKKTEEKTGLVVFDPQTQILIKAAADMRARVAAQEVRVEWMRSFAAPENPALVRATQELAALRDQESKLETGDRSQPGIDVPLGNVPASSLEYERSLREVEFREALVSLLKQQLEAMRVDEERTDLTVQPVVQMLDKAAPPEKASAPHRFVIVLSVTSLAILLAVLVVSAMEKIDRAKLGRKPPVRVPLYTYHPQELSEKIWKSG